MRGRPSGVVVNTAPPVRGVLVAMRVVTMEKGCIVLSNDRTVREQNVIKKYRIG